MLLLFYRLIERINAESWRAGGIAVRRVDEAGRHFIRHTLSSAEFMPGPRQRAGGCT